MCAQRAETKRLVGTIFPDKFDSKCDLQAQIVSDGRCTKGTLGVADFRSWRMVESSIVDVYMSMIMNGLFEKVG